MLVAGEGHRQALGSDLAAGADALGSRDPAAAVREKPGRVGVTARGVCGPGRRRRRHIRKYLRGRSFPSAEILALGFRIDSKERLRE